MFESLLTYEHNHDHCNEDGGDGASDNNSQGHSDVPFEHCLVPAGSKGGLVAVFDLEIL